MPKKDVTLITGTHNLAFNNALEEMAAVHEAKSHDYAEGENPYANFEGAARLTGLTVDSIFHVMCSIKMERLRQLVGNNKEPRNESILDTIIDLANYAALWYSYNFRGSITDV